nr:LysM peptidoglycan-binding domain-containing protein [Actinoplanes rectilineatus]
MASAAKPFLRPIPGRPVGGRPVAGRPAGGRPVAGRPAGERPSTGGTGRTGGTVRKGGVGISVHVVRHGDTLTSIAAQHDITGGWRHLYRLNDELLRSPHLLYPGQRITL